MRSISAVFKALAPARPAAREFGPPIVVLAASAGFAVRPAMAPSIRAVVGEKVWRWRLVGVGLELFSAIGMTHARGPFFPRRRLGMLPRARAAGEDS